MITESLLVIDPRDVRRLEAVAADLRLLIDEGMPPEEVLRKAPLLDGWSRTFVPQPAIIGRIHAGGPALARPLFALSRESLWARSLGGWIRLGRHASHCRPSRP